MSHVVMLRLAHIQPGTQPTLTFKIGVHIYVYLFSKILPSYTVLLGSIRLLDLCQIHPIRFLFGLCLLH